MCFLQSETNHIAVFIHFGPLIASGPELEKYIEYFSRDVTVKGAIAVETLFAVQAGAPNPDKVKMICMVCCKPKIATDENTADKTMSLEQTSVPFS